MTVLAALATAPALFWVAATVAGLCMGSSQSAGRALVGVLSPEAQRAEFYGLWTISSRLAASLGPMTYGLVTWLTGGEHRVAIISTGLFFVLGLLLLASVDVARGVAAPRAPGCPMPWPRARDDTTRPRGVAPAVRRRADTRAGAPRFRRRPARAASLRRAVDASLKHGLDPRDYHAVWRYLVRSAADGTMLDALMVTMRRLLIGFIAGVVDGIPLGLFIARFQWACDTIGVLALGLQALPSVRWVPLALLWFGKRKPRCSSW